MKKLAIFLAVMMIASAALACGVCGDSTRTGCGKTAEECTKSICSNPIKETIDQTPSVKAMQSQSARPLGYTRDVLGNKVATQTDNSGQNYLGR
jgi:hypothetical protein